MGLSNDIYQSVSEAFNGDLKDAVRTITLRKPGETFDPLTNSVSYVNLDYNTRGVIGEFELEEINNSSVMPNDVRAIILQNELTETPEIDDLLISNLGTFKIVKVMQDPANVIWGLQCRK